MAEETQGRMIGFLVEGYKSTGLSCGYIKSWLSRCGYRHMEKSSFFRRFFYPNEYGNHELINISLVRTEYSFIINYYWRWFGHQPPSYLLCTNRYLNAAFYFHQALGTLVSILAACRLSVSLEAMGKKERKALVRLVSPGNIPWKSESTSFG